MTKTSSYENLAESLESALRFARASGAWILPGQAMQETQTEETERPSVRPGGGVARESLRNIRKNLFDGDAVASAKAKGASSMAPAQRDACVVFVGDGLCADEVGLAEPFDAKSMKLLHEMVSALGLSRNQAIFTAVLDEYDSTDSTGSAHSFSWEQVSELGAGAVCPMGAKSLERILKLAGIPGDSAGRPGAIQVRGAAVVPVHHPLKLLKNPLLKREAWEALKTLARIIHEIS